MRIPFPSISRKTLKANLTSYLFLAPSLVLFIVFMIVPLIWTIRLSFFKGGLLSGLQYVGLQNYLTIFQSSTFINSLKNTAQYVLMVIPTVIVISLVLAVFIMDKYVYGKNLFKSAVFFPQLSPMVMCAMLWTFFIHPEFGLFNAIFNLLGLPVPNWLGDPKLALITITLLELWRGIGFYVVLYVSALVAIPEELYDAGLIDGAVGMSRFFYITLPLIRPTLLFSLVMATIWNFQLFDSVYVLTRGGPVGSTSTVVWYIYDNAFQFEKVGKAATMAVILMVIIMVLSYLELRYLQTDVEY